MAGRAPRGLRLRVRLERKLQLHIFDSEAGLEFKPATTADKRSVKSGLSPGDRNKKQSGFMPEARTLDGSRAVVLPEAFQAEALLKWVL